MKLNLLTLLSIRCENNRNTNLDILINLSIIKFSYKFMKNDVKFILK